MLRDGRASRGTHRAHRARREGVGVRGGPTCCGGEVVGPDAEQGGGELGESAAPGLEAVAEDAEGVAGAAEGVAAVVVGLVGVVVDGPEQRGGAGACVPPGFEEGPGAPQGHPGYPPAV